MTKLIAVLLLATCGAAQAATLRAGPGQTYASPSAAIAVAQPGDTVLIAPGEYFDCAIIARDHITVAGDGPGVTLTDKTCQGKAILVIAGADTIVRDLTLTRARVPDRNGAGIRSEGTGLTVERVRFIDNENGILTADNPGNMVRVIDSEFRANGRCMASCAHAIYAGHIGDLIVLTSHFSDTRQGHHIKSRAARTTLSGNTIEDGPAGTASYLVELPNGGDLSMRDNTLEKGPRAGDMRAAIMLGSETGGPADAKQVIVHNSFRNDTGEKPAFVLNWGSGSPLVSDNLLPEGIDPLSEHGATMHRIHSGLYAIKSFMLDLIRFAKYAVAKVIAHV